MGIQQATPEMIEQWKKENEEVWEMTGELDDYREVKVYFRKPKRADTSRLIKEIAKDPERAVNNLIFGCLLYPPADELKKEIEKRPGLIMVLGNELQKLIGSNVDFLSKKL